MLLFEHEGKAFLREYDISTPRGAVVGGVGEVGAALAVVPLPAMVKAQVLAGGRGKAGGILAARTAGDVERQVGALGASRVKGLPVERVLVEEQVTAAREWYAAMTLDGEHILALLSRRGGMDVEAFFRDQRDAFEVIPVEPLFGLAEYQVRNALDRLGVEAGRWPPFCALLTRLARMFRDLDATLVEINPLAEMDDGTLVALDARVEVDEGAFFRQPRLRAIHEGRPPGSDLLGRMRALEIQFVPLGGAVGLVSSGAGAGVTIMDWVAREGSRVAGFMDLDYAIIGGRTEEALRLAIAHLDGEPSVRSLLVNFTTCGLRLDLIAATLVKVLDELGGGQRKPLFIHLAGNRGPAAQVLVRQAGYRICETLGEAVRGASRAAAGDGRP
jgi:succinyl-CoA synthetase beta subunit